IAALLNPASRSPNDHCSAASPAGSAPSGAFAKSASVHFRVLIVGRAGAVPAPGDGPGAGGTHTLPSSRALGPPGRRLSTGSTTNGSASRSIVTRSIASAAIASLTAATARIGSPWYSGSLV